MNYGLTGTVFDRYYRREIDKKVAEDCINRPNDLLDIHEHLKGVNQHSLQHYFGDKKDLTVMQFTPWYLKWFGEQKEKNGLLTYNDVHNVRIPNGMVAPLSPEIFKDGELKIRNAKYLLLPTFAPGVAVNIYLSLLFSASLGLLPARHAVL